MSLSYVDVEVIMEVDAADMSTLKTAVAVRFFVVRRTLAWRISPGTPSQRHSPALDQCISFNGEAIAPGSISAPLATRYASIPMRYEC
jgi:hypothetical protein